MNRLMRELDLAWAGGLFEGEGSCGSQGPTGIYGRRTARLLLGMKDEDIVRRFARVVGAGKIYKRNTGSAVWAWQTTTRTDFRKVVGLLYPWVGERRRAKMEEVLVASLLPAVPYSERWDTRRRRNVDL